MFEHIVFELDGGLHTQLLFYCVDQLACVDFASAVFFVDLEEVGIFRFGFHYDVKL